MSCQRPPTHADKAPHITSIAELKRKAGMLLAEFTKGKGLYWQDELWRKRVVEILEENLKNISEFEASVKERLKEIAMPSHISPYADEKELRRILGAGDH